MQVHVTASMMIHPNYRTDPQATFAHWVRTIRDHWESILEGDVADRDRVDLLQEFQNAYNDIAATTDDLPSWDHVLRRLPRALRETRVEEVNAAGGATPVIDWKRNYAWILVGGQVLDRGFTVAGLTVTYMPRGVGVGNADTVQQRARWFGYKASYLGYCRVFLSDDVIGAFRDYVEHEEDMRDRLLAHLASGKSLKQWKRAFLLSGALSPTRRSVLGVDITRGNYSDRWFSPRSPHVSADAFAANAELVRSFVASGPWEENEDPRLLDSHRHSARKSLQLQQVYSSLLVDVTYASPKDSLDYTGLLIQISAYLRDNPSATCSVYWMRPAETTARGTDDEGEEISQLFQGAYPVDGEPKIYPGDRRVRSDDELTIQLHTVDVYHGPVSRGELIAESVPIVAVWVPQRYSAPWVVQGQDATS